MLKPQPPHLLCSKCGRKITNLSGRPIKLTCCGVEFSLPANTNYEQTLKLSACEESHRIEWPAWAKAIAIFRKPEDIGIGDTFHRLAERFGAEWVIKKLGINCGCQIRHKEWNEAYNYETMPA